MNNKKIGLIFSHKLSGEQREDMEKNLKVKEILYLKEDLQKKWSNIPPELESLEEYLSEILYWIDDNFSKGDYILVQGDFGATYIVVEYCKVKELIPIYSTTKRIAIEESLEDGTTRNINHFKHIRFRKY